MYTLVVRRRRGDETEMRQKIYILFFYIILFTLIFISVSFAGPQPKIGIIYPSLSVSEEFSSFTQVVLYFNKSVNADIYPVNSKSDLDSLLYVYKLLKKKGIKRFLVKDESIDLTPFYKKVSKKDMFFSFSPSFLLPERKNLFRVMPTYIDMVDTFLIYAKKEGSPPIYIILNKKAEKDFSTLSSLLQKYKNKWKILDIKEVFTPFGLKEDLFAKGGYIFLYTTSYAQAGIFAQLLKSTIGDFHLIVFANVLSPSFLSLVKKVKNQIFLETDVDLRLYKKLYESFKSTISPEDFVASQYDFSKMKFLQEHVVFKSHPKIEHFKLRIVGIKEYE